MRDRLGGEGAALAGLSEREVARDLAQVRAAEYGRQQREHEQGLVARFGAENARRILAKELWQGATAEMIRLMLGVPDDTSTRVYKTKITETWKYRPLGKNRYELKVKVENGVCVGWETAS